MAKLMFLLSRLTFLALVESRGGGGHAHSSNWKSGIGVSGSEGSKQTTDKAPSVAGLAAVASLPTTPQSTSMEASATRSISPNASLIAGIILSIIVVLVGVSFIITRGGGGGGRGIYTEVKDTFDEFPAPGASMKPFNPSPLESYHERFYDSPTSILRASEEVLYDPPVDDDPHWPYTESDVRPSGS
ncbi:hypothetical protein DL96DRAFT_1583641 [Flagelloscypha sp. PMI_526]|nr:hypothetical protein DL96DRAFT_1583641 [Flagelloscypha sp. PMI_526]